MNFTLSQLKYLLALDKHRSFVKAAEECFVTQPTLSMQLKKLEESLDTILIDRSQQPIAPTEVGRLVILQAKKIVAEATYLEAVLNNAKDEVVGLVRIGIIPTLAPYLIPLFLPAFMKKYPEILVDIVEVPTRDLVEMLKNNDLDVGIAATPLKVDGLSEIPLFYESFVAYVQNADEHILEKKFPVSFFESEEKWLLSEGNCLREQVISLCGIKQQRGNDRRLNFESASVTSLLAMVEQYGGVTFLPYLSTLSMKNERIGHIRYLSDQKYREVGLISHSIYSKKPLIKALKKAILANLPQGVSKERPKMADAIIPIDRKILEARK